MRAVIWMPVALSSWRRAPERDAANALPGPIRGIVEIGQRIVQKGLPMRAVAAVGKPGLDYRTDALDRAWVLSPPDV